MSDLAAFLLARFAGDEAAAQAVTDAIVTRAGPDWSVDPEPVDGPLPGTVVAVLDGPDAVAFVRGLPAAAHIARHDPARVLADCAAKRRIVEKCQNIIDRHFSDDFTADRLAEEVLELLAIPYSDHPGFDPGWRIQ